MAKKKKRESLVRSRNIIIGLVLIVILGSILGSYGRKLLEESKKNVMEDYYHLAQSVAGRYETEIYVVSQASKVFSNMVIDSEDIFNPENIEILSKMVEGLSVSNVYLVKPDYSAVDANGNKYETIIALPGYDNAFKGNSTTTIFIHNTEGEDVILVPTPIVNNLELLGYILAEYKPNVMDTILEQAKFSPQNTYALVSSDGIVIERAGAKSTFLTEQNDLINEDVIYRSGSRGLLKQAVTIQRNADFQITKNGEMEYIFIVPIPNNRANIVMAVDDSIINVGFARENRSIRSMLMTILTIIGIFLLVVLGASIFSKAKHNMESEDLQNKADTDQLTDLYNKMATERLIKEYLEGEGSDKTSMLFLLDVDNFKKINDTMGHAFGDEVLMNLGHQIKAWFRVNDIVGRIGGDEFMVFIKDIKDEAVVKREGNRIKQFFEGFTVGDYTKYSPTASIGGAVFPNDAKDFESLYKAADKAVYKSKKDGKNRVSFYSDLDKSEQEAEPDKTGRD
ncbi:MAG: diguanylate cyclase [Lachnospiraceae bacterium]|nr:diguanylate cyclase [Lachnospiraceae bacterium]